MDHDYKILTGFQVGDIVRVESRHEKECYWKAKIVKIHTMGTLANVTDVNPTSVWHGEISCVRIGQLKIWDPSDDVNI